MRQGTEIIQLMVRNMPEDLFQQLAARARVGLFTFDDKTTIFPEYEHLRDTPECAGRLHCYTINIAGFNQSRQLRGCSVFLFCKLMKL